MVKIAKRNLSGCLLCDRYYENNFLKPASCVYVNIKSQIHAYYI